MSPFGIARRHRAASAAEVDALLREDAVRAAAAKLLPRSPSFAHAYSIATGSARRGSLSGEADDARAFITAAPAARATRACAPFPALAAARRARSSISLPAAVAWTVPSWKNDIILAGTVDAGAARILRPTWRICVRVCVRACASEVGFISEGYERLRGTVAPPDRHAQADPVGV